MIFDRLENWPRYFDAEAWRCAFDFLQSLTAESAEQDNIALQGDEIFAQIMSYDTVEPDKSKLEAHDRYVDIQMSLVNSEGIDWHPREGLTVKTPYDEGRDRVLYELPGPALARINNAPGIFSVLFPEDAHMPKLITGNVSERVKKVVVKLALDLAPPPRS